MRRTAIWEVAEEGPQRLSRTNIDLEQQLEDWIEQEPSLLQEGLTIIGRQLQTEAGPLDILALDPQGRWLVIENKRGQVYRETIAQALDYAACITSMPFGDLAEKANHYLSAKGTSLEDLLSDRGGLADAQQDARDVGTIIVGVGTQPGLERMVEYLTGTFGVPIAVVVYDVFEVDAGRRILVRELTQDEDVSATPRGWQPRTVEVLCRLADRNGIGRSYRQLLEAAQRHGIHPSPRKHCIMYTPPSNRTRSLFTVNASSVDGGRLSLWLQSSVFPEFYQMDQEAVVTALGEEGWHKLDRSQVETLVAGLDRLFAGVAQAE